MIGELPMTLRLTAAKLPLALKSGAQTSSLYQNHQILSNRELYDQHFGQTLEEGTFVLPENQVLLYIVVIMLC